MRPSVFEEAATTTQSAATGLETVDESVTLVVDAAAAGGAMGMEETISPRLRSDAFSTGKSDRRSRSLPAGGLATLFTSNPSAGTQLNPSQTRQSSHSLAAPSGTHFTFTPPPSEAGLPKSYEPILASEITKGNEKELFHASYRRDSNLLKEQGGHSRVPTRILNLTSSEGAELLPNTAAGSSAVAASTSSVSAAVGLGTSPIPEEEVGAEGERENVAEEEDGEAEVVSHIDDILYNMSARSFELSHFDSLASYGFRDSTNTILDRECQEKKFLWLQSYAARLEEQEKEWAVLQANANGLAHLSAKEYKNLTRNGIPAALRARVWWHWLNPEPLIASSSADYYSNLLLSPETLCNPEDYRNVMKDVDRTFTTHPMFKDPEGPGVAALKNILLAYAIRNPAIGYCQSENFLAAFLLLFYDEEAAFWMLCCLIEKFLPSDYYSSNMIGIQTDVAVMIELIRLRMPKLWSHLNSLEPGAFHMEGILTGWFLCMFIKTTPIETTLRIWDSMFVEGSKVLFRVGLALLENKEKELRAEQDFGLVFQTLNQLGKDAYDCDQIMRKAFSIKNIKR
jgi:hypothetical protein